MSTFAGVCDQLNSGGSQIEIATPEQVELQFGIAGIGSRFVAQLVDLLIMLAFFFVEFLCFLGLAAAAPSQPDAHLDTAGKWFVAFVILINFLVFWGYFTLFEALWRGQTPGKRLMKLRVIKDSGRQITFFESLARNLIRFLELFIPGLYLTAVVTMLCNRRNKRLGDFAAGTIVVHESLEETPLVFQTSTTLVAPVSFAAHEPERLAPWATPVEARFPADAVARLGAQDLVVIETFFARMLDLPLDTRAAMAQRIAAQLTAKMGVALPEGNPERTMESIAFQMRGGRGS